MKYVKILFAVALVFSLCSAFSMKKGEPKAVYAFGFASSFTDTVAYYTDNQLLDSVKLTKEGFLPHRDLYSYQLKNYLEYSKVQENSTCMIYFSKNKAKLHKELTKLLNKYKKNKKASVECIEIDKFKFTKPSDE